MENQTLCPNCGHQNRNNSKFCKTCGASLDVAPELQNIMLARSDGEITNVLKPAIGKTTFFNGKLGFKQITYASDQECRYIVIPLDSSLGVKRCSNQECRAVILSIDEAFCGECGQNLQNEEVPLLMIERLIPFPKSIASIVERQIACLRVCPPLFQFNEEFNDQMRYYVVSPAYDANLQRPEPSRILSLVYDLIYRLAFLHIYEVSFDGNISDNTFGMADGEIVWVNFEQAVSATQEAKGRDIQSLARLALEWITGQKDAVSAPNLHPAINVVIQDAIKGNILSAQDLLDAFRDAEEHVKSEAKVDQRVGRLTHVGMVRKLNEDSLFTAQATRVLESQPRAIGLYLVADGMGGHAAGEVASGQIVSVVAQKAFNSLFVEAAPNIQDWLKMCVEEANRSVFEVRKSAGTDMGSTLVIAVVTGDQAYIAHVGDSRIYRINQDEISQLTTDHSLVERLVANGQITREQARTHEQKNVVYRVVGDKPKIEVDIAVHALKPGDFLLLCSDGLSGMVTDDWLQKIVLDALSPQEACEKLIEAANNAGGDDNITAIVAQLAGA